MSVHPGNLAGKGPMGLKAPKPSPKGLRRTPKRPTKAESKHMGDVASLPCLVCGAWPVEVHHEGKPRCNFRVLPLCPPHHRREFGPGAYHYSPRAFYALHGSSEALLQRVAKMLTARDDDCLAAWF